MKKLPYEKVWFSLDDYLKDNTFGKPYLSTVPPKWKKEFSTITEMYNTIMLDIQHHVNLFFNELFSHVEVNVMPINKVKLIKAACYSTFVSKLYGMLITDKNVKQTFSNNSGYSIEENQTRETNHYQDIFTPSALKALNQTQIKQLWKVYNTWEQVLSHINDKNFDYIYTAAEIDELIEIIRIESENLFKDIAAYVEDRLDKYKTELSNDVELIENISTSLVENEELVNRFEEKLETKFTEKLDEIDVELDNKINRFNNSNTLNIDYFDTANNNETIFPTNFYNENLETNSKSALSAINEIFEYIKNPNNKYFIGQIISVKKGTTLQEGWKIFDIGNGATLIQGDNSDGQFGGGGLTTSIRFAAKKSPWEWVNVGGEGSTGMTGKKGEWDYMNVQPANKNYAYGFGVEFWEYVGV